MEWNGPGAIEIVVDHNEDVYVLYYLDGETTINGVNFQSAGITDILLIKYNTHGDMLWSRQIGNADGDHPTDLVIGATNDVFITGDITSNTDFMGEPFDVAHGRGFVARISPAGSLVWMKQFGEAGQGGGGAVAVDAQGNVLVGGQSNDDVSLLYTLYNSAGTTLWTSPIVNVGCCVPPVITDIEADAQGNFIVTGTFSSRVVFPDPVGSRDATGFSSTFVAKLSPSGEYLWYKQIDDTGGALEDARSVGLELDAASDIYLLGHFTEVVTLGPNTFQEENDNIRNGFLAKMSSSTGDILWGRVMYAYDMIPTDFLINTKKNEILFSGLSDQFFNYNNEYILPPMVRVTQLIATDLDGHFKRATLVNNDAYPTYSLRLAVNKNDETFITGSFANDFTLGCFDFDNSSYLTNFFVKLGKLPEISIGSHNVVCRAETLRIQVYGADLATKFAWRFSGGVNPVGNVYETTVPYIDVVVDDVDTAYVNVVPFYYCHPRTEYALMLTIHNAPEKPGAPEGPAVLCQNASAVYQATPLKNGETYRWMVVGDLQIISDVGNQLNIKAVGGSGIATIKVKSVNMCGESEFSDPIDIELRSLPQPPIISGPDSICTFRDEEYSATSVDAERYRWGLSPGFFLKTSNSDSSSVRFNSNVTGVQTITAASVGYCGVSAFKEFVIDIFTAPNSITVTGENAVCAGEIQITYTITPQQAGEVSWNFPAGFIKTDETDFTITFATAGNAMPGSISAKLEGFCASVTSSILVGVFRVPAKPSIRIDDCNTTLTYAGNDSFTWFRDAIALNDTKKELIVADSGSYHLEVSNLCGSVSSDAIVADPVSAESVFVPNVVTAPGEGKNDVFTVDDALKGSSLTIFNRWGKMVFETTNYRNTWNGEDLAGGSYYYVLKSKCLEDPLKGIIHLIK
jgi:gliding motility-associated-like protein